MPVYGATYSGVTVLELPTPNVSVMRRTSDSWVNATHILKVANFDKPHRTRILEKVIQMGQHEKVQGGYGKYQGTWVPLERARAIAKDYKVTEELQPLFDFDITTTVPPAPKSVAKAKSAPKKSAASVHAKPSAKRTKSNTSNAPAKKKQKPASRPPRAAESLSADSASVSSRSSSPSEMLSDASENHGRLTLKSHNRASVSAQPYHGSAAHNRQRQRNSGSNHATYDDNDDGEDSYMYGQNFGHTAYTNSARHGMEYDTVAADYRNKLLDYFMAPDEENVPDFLVHPPPGFKINQVIDDEGHTAFHWACAMGHIKIIEALLDAGADITAENNLGHTPLVRAIMFTNNYERRMFPRVVDLLRSTIFHFDENNRTVLHHIAATTASRSKLSSTRYYAESILSKLSESQAMPVVTTFVNRQDDNGDTALHIAARNGARKCVKVLLSYQASPNLVNKNGRTAQEYIYEYETQKQSLAQQRDYSNMHEQWKSSSSPITVPYGHHQQQISVNGYLQQPGNKYLPAYYETSAYNETPPFVKGTENGIIHTSGAAIQASQQVAPSISSMLEQLASCYDSESRENEADVEQVRQLLGNTKEDVAGVEKNIQELSKNLGDERQVSMLLQQASELVNTRGRQLRKLVERSQARDLAMLVQKEETRMSQTIQQEIQQGQTPDMETNIMLSLELSNLQENRKKLVDEIVSLCASAGAGEKMNDYRRLVSLSCGVKFDEIDDLLEGIGQALEASAD